MVWGKFIQTTPRTFFMRESATVTVELTAVKKAVIKIPIIISTATTATTVFKVDTTLSSAASL